MTEWRIPIEGDYISANGRQHYMAKARRTKEIRLGVWLECKKQHIPNLDRHCETQLIYYPPTGNHPDPLNLAPTEKAAVDGMVGIKLPTGQFMPGILTDDSKEFVRCNVPIIAATTPNKRGVYRARIYLIVRQLADPILVPSVPDYADMADERRDARADQ